MLYLCNIMNLLFINQSMILFMNLVLSFLCLRTKVWPRPFSASGEQLQHENIKDPLSTNKTSVVKLLFTNRSLVCLRSVQSPLCFEPRSDRSISLAIVQQPCENSMLTFHAPPGPSEPGGWGGFSPPNNLLVPVSTFLKKCCKEQALC